MLLGTPFGFWDWAVVVLTFGISIFIGLYFWVKNWCSQEKVGVDNLLIGDRNMNPLFISVSMLVTYFSAIAIIGYPTEIFAHGIQIFFMNLILSVICIPASVYIFVIVLHKLKLTSVYEYLQLRYQSPLVRSLASAIFILETTIISGVALYVPAIPLHKFLGFSTITSIISIGFCGTLYTSLGGLKAVVFTDCFQFLLILLGLGAIVWRGMALAGGFWPAFQIAYDSGRLNCFDLNIDPFQNYNTLNILVGYGLSLTWFYGAHQPNFQRYSSLPSVSAAIRGMFYNVLFQEVAFILIILAGIALVAVYVGCDPNLTGSITRADEIVPWFVQEELSFIPGMMGLFVSCILSAVLSTISSSLNSLAAVTWEDFISKIKFCRFLSPTGKERTMIGLSFFYGFLIMGIAYLASKTDSIFQTSIIVMGSTSGTLGGVFIMALFVPGSNAVGVSIGMVVGLCSVCYLSAQNLMMGLSRIPLPTSLDACGGLNPGNFSLLPTPSNINISKVEIDSYPEKLYTVSIVLYPVIAATITATVGIIASYSAAYFKPGNHDEKPEELERYLHPVVVMGRKYFETIKDPKISKTAHEKINEDFGIELKERHSLIDERGGVY